MRNDPARSSAQKAAAKERYLAAVEEFQIWCARRGLPFKWAMIQAMQRYQNLHRTEEEAKDGTHP